MPLPQPRLFSALTVGAIAVLCTPALAQKTQAPHAEVHSPVRVPDLPPLEELTATRERPLFMPTRRPPAAVPQVAAEAPPQVVPKEEAPADLTGIVMGPEKAYAIFKSRTSDEIVHVSRGDAIDDWTLDEIGARHVVLHHGADRIRVELFEKQDAEGQSAPANAEPRPVIRRPPQPAVRRPLHPALRRPPQLMRRRPPPHRPRVAQSRRPRPQVVRRPDSDQNDD